MAQATPQQLRRAVARAGSGKARLARRDRGAALGAGRRPRAPHGGRCRPPGSRPRPTPSRTPARSSSRSPCSVATTATTARSPSRPPSWTTRSSRPTRSSRSPRRDGRWAARKRSSRSATDRRSGTTSRARWLDERGYGSTLGYLRAVAIRVIEETGLLPHLNPGVMSYEELARLKHVSASMGMMLETSSDRLTERGGPHFGSPDKVPGRPAADDRGRRPARRSRSRPASWWASARRRASAPESLFAIRDLHRRYRHVQEVIVQNFRAKPGTAMRHAPEPEDEEFLAAVATARIVLGPHMSVQAPPNLSDPEQQLRLLDAGINDWGGVSPLTPDHVNPEKPWPTLEALTATTAERGLHAPRAPHDLRPVRPAAPIRTSRRRCALPSRRCSAPTAWRSRDRSPEPVAWQDPDVQWKPRTIELTFSKAAGCRSPRGRDVGLRRLRRARRHPRLVDERHRARSDSRWRSRSRSRRRPPIARAHRRGRARAVPRGGPRARRALPRRRRPAIRGRGRRGHLRRSIGTSTSPTSATSGAGSARSPSGRSTPSRTR